MALENGEILHVNELIDKKVEKCPHAVNMKGEIDHMKESIEGLKQTDETIFKKFELHSSKIDGVKDSLGNKLDANEKANSGRWISFLIVLVVQLLAFGSGLLMIFLKVK